MRNGIMGARYLKLARDLAWMFATCVVIKFTLDGSLGFTGFWYLGILGFAVLMLGLSGFFALVRIYSFFRKPIIVHGRIDGKGFKTRYEMDVESGKGYEQKSKKYEISVDNEKFKITSKVFNWVAIGDLVSITYIPSTDEVTWVDDGAAARRINAEVYYEQSQYSKAIKEYTIAIRLNRQARATQRHHRIHAKTFYQRGLAYAANREYNLAIFDYSSALRAQHRIKIQYYTTDTTGSIGSLGEEAQMRRDADYERADIYYHRGLAYAAKGEHIIAIADYTKAITLYPQYEDLYMARAEAYLAMDNQGNALNDFTEFTKRSHDHRLIEQAKERIHDIQQNKRV